MNTTYKIVKNELRLLFYSPVAWLILVIFALQASIDYAELLGRELQDKATGHNLADLTASLFGGFRGVFTRIQQYLYLYIPLLTMSIMSRELGSGSIKLLLSSPVTSGQIVLGKYLALAIYGLLLAGVLALLALFSLATVRSMDLPLVLSGLLGLYLLTCAYAAIGLFMSSLTSYQMAAAIGTLAVLALLNFIGTVGQEIELARDITYWLSISGRATTTIRGLICSEDVLYFFIVTALFLALAILRLQARRRKRPRAVTVARYAATVILALGAGYLSSRPPLMFYHDATAMKSQTLTPGSQAVMREMKGGLSITTYVNLLDANYWDVLPRNYNNDVRRFRQYVRFKPEIKMKYVYYYDHADNPSLDLRYPDLDDEGRARELAKGSHLKFERLLPPAGIRRLVDLAPEGNHLVRHLQRDNGQASFLRVYNDMARHPSESEISAALKRLVVKPPRVAFLAGHGERDILRVGDDGYYVFARSLDFRHSLVNQGFDMETLSLAGLTEIPPGVDVLVIADPREPLSHAEQEIISRHLAAGGDLLLAVKPGRQHLVAPVADALGIRFTDGTLVREHPDLAPDLLLGRITGQAALISGVFGSLASLGHTIQAPGAVGILPAPAGSLPPFRALPLVVTDSAGCWNELETADFINDIPRYNPAAGEREANLLPLVLALAREVNGREQRVMVLGNADYLSNGELLKSRKEVRSANYSLITETFRWFTRGEFPVDTRRFYGPDNDIRLSTNDTWWIKALFSGLIPALLLAGGLVTWIKRRRV
jgi:ABC-2 type transport system permease protein